MSETGDHCGSCRFFLLTDSVAEDPSGACRWGPPSIHATQWVGQPIPPPMRAGQQAPPQIGYQVTRVAAAFPTLSAKHGWCGRFEPEREKMN